MTVWTAPRTWVDGEVVTAAEMNAGIRDNLLVLRAGPLAIVQYGTAGIATYTLNTSSLTALDTTNLVLPSFTVPASGQVLVKMTAGFTCANTGGLRSYFGITIHGTSTAVGYLMAVHHGTAVYGGSVAVSQLITGLTPGAATVWDWAGYSQTTASVSATTTATPGSLGMPALMEVWAA